GDVTIAGAAACALGHRAAGDVDTAVGLARAHCGMQLLDGGGPRALRPPATIAHERAIAVLLELEVPTGPVRDLVAETLVALGENRAQLVGRGAAQRLEQRRGIERRPLPYAQPARVAGDADEGQRGRDAENMRIRVARQQAREHDADGVSDRGGEHAHPPRGVDEGSEEGRSGHDADAWLSAYSQAAGARSSRPYTRATPSA